MPGGRQGNALTEGIHRITQIIFGCVICPAPQERAPSAGVRPPGNGMGWCCTSQSPQDPSSCPQTPGPSCRAPARPPHRSSAALCGSCARCAQWPLGTSTASAGALCKAQPCSEQHEKPSMASQRRGCRCTAGGGRPAITPLRIADDGVVPKQKEAQLMRWLQLSCALPHPWCHCSFCEI